MSENKIIVIDENMGNNLDMMTRSLIGMQKTLDRLKNLSVHAQEFDVEKIYEMEKKLDLVLICVAKLNLNFKIIFDKHMEVFQNCLVAEKKRIEYLKEITVRAQRYQYANGLRDIEKEFDGLLEMVASQ